MKNRRVILSNWVSKTAFVELVEDYESRVGDYESRVKKKVPNGVKKKVPNGV